LKERGLGQKGIKSAVLPLVYTDNSESATGANERAAKCVIPPERFGETYENLGWKKTAHKSEPIIKSERPQVQVSLEDDKRTLKFRIVASLNKKRAISSRILVDVCLWQHVQQLGNRGSKNTGFSGHSSRSGQAIS
jgi:hypothetical protein